MLKIALPNKGSLSEESVELFKKAGYRCRRSGRELMVVDADNEIEFFYLRPRDIAVYVGNGVVDLGITGRDLAIDSGTRARERGLGHSFGSNSSATPLMQCRLPVGGVQRGARSLPTHRIAPSVRFRLSRYRKKGASLRSRSWMYSTAQSVKTSVAWPDSSTTSPSYRM